MSKYIRATQKTKSKIRETFWQIYQKKPIEKISVREIAEAANYNRSTFYEYYSDVYSVLEEIEEMLFEELFQNRNQLILEYSITLDELIYELAQSYRKHKKYLKILMGKNGDPRFLDKVKDHFKTLIAPLISAADFIAEENLNYYLEYMTNGLIGMLMYWQQKDSKLSIEDFLEKCKDIILPEGDVFQKI